eukprot:gene10831-2908_t
MDDVDDGDGDVVVVVVLSKNAQERMGLLSFLSRNGAITCAFLVWSSSIIAVLNTPYTKVEESFNVQAIHDLLYLRGNLSKYDHFEFPGVVPRTFLGGILVALPTRLIISLIQTFSPSHSKEMGLLVVRMCLASFNGIALWKFFISIQSKFSSNIMWMTAIITASQFHFAFYLSRPLPNTFAMPLVIWAYSYWLKRDVSTVVMLFAIAAPIFRAELVVLAAPLLISEVFIRNSISLYTVLVVGISTGMIAINSFFWGRLLWPEGEVLWFNAILNRSSDYGIEPFWWYFTSALPRCLSTRPYIYVIATFVLLYSILPHKELRFILYVIPIFNLAAACGATYVIQKRIFKSAATFRVFNYLFVMGIILGCLVTTIIFSLASLHNYPGGYAIRWLNTHCAPNCGTEVNPVNVHICNLAAQTGVSRFSETNPGFRKQPYATPAGVSSMLWNSIWLTRLYVPRCARLRFDTHTEVLRQGQEMAPGLLGVRFSRSVPFVHFDYGDVLTVLLSRDNNRPVS